MPFCAGVNCLSFLFVVSLCDRFLVCAMPNVLTLSCAKVMKSLLSSPFFFARPFGGDFVPNTSTIVPTQLVFSISCGCTGHLSFRLLLYSATTSWFSAHTRVSVLSRPHLALDPIAVHMLSAITPDRAKPRHLCPNRSGRPCRSLSVLPVEFSSSFFLNLNKRLMAFLSPILGFCKDNKSNDPFFAMQKCAIIWLQMKLTITEYSLTATRTATSRRKELYTWYCVCVVKTHDTNDNVTTKTQSTFHTKHMNIDT